MRRGRTRAERERRRDIVYDILIILFAVLAVLLGFAVLLEGDDVWRDVEEAEAVLRASDAVEDTYRRALEAPDTMPQAEAEPVALQGGPEYSEAEPVEEPVAVPYYHEAIPLPAEEQAALYAACQEFEVPFALALGVMEQETRFQMLTGDGGASVGFFQVQARWWGWLMEEIGVDDLSDPEGNIRTGCAVLGYLLEEYGTETAALTAYNTGSPGESSYASEVLERADRWRARL